MSSIVLLLCLGVVLGFLSGLFGVGGSSIATPLLRMMDVPRLVALASPLPVTLPIALIGGITYWRRGLVRGRAVVWTAVGGVPAVVGGSYLTAVVPGRFLMVLTGLFVSAVGVRLLRRPLGAERAGAPNVRSAGLLVVVGVGIGVLSGLLGNGGGFLLVPDYLLLCHLTPQEAAGTSLAGVALLALPGTWVHWHLGHIDLKLVVLLALGVIPSTYVGARLGLSLRTQEARWLFGLFLLLVGVLFLLRTLYRAEVYGWLG